MSHPALDVRDLNAWYDTAHVLRDINLTVHPGQLVCILGRHGSGRTTVLRTLLGLAGSRSGSVRINGTESIHLPPHSIKPLGLSYCPEEHYLIDDLSCEENLLLPVEGESTLGGGMSLADIYDIFPVLKPFQHQPIGHLHTPERQLLAVARALRLGTNVLLLDEINDSINPIVASAMARALAMLKEQRYTIVMASEAPGSAVDLADQFYVIQGGTLVNARAANSQYA
ncbi:MAG: ATP-binding cassette domain-containing protein [Pusillimonas sp.]